MSQTAAPTRQTFGVLQEAFDSMNAELFENELPQCMILVVRKSRAHGYFWSNKFQKIGTEGAENLVDEIALNPDTMNRPAIEVLSTLAHEMAHLWQFRFGKPSRNGYHNKEWAKKMHRIGLIPSDDGKPGGKETGQNMTHYIQRHGVYQQWAEKFLNGRNLEWASTQFLLESEAEERERKALIAAKTKSKYSCGEHNVWGKPDLILHCGICGKDMEAVD